MPLTPSTLNGSPLHLSCADIADDDVTSKRNYIRRLASFSVFTYIESCKMTFISKY